MRRHALEHPGDVIRVVARQAELRAWLQHARERIEERRLDQAALVVAGLGPRVGEQHESARDRGGRETVEERSRVVVPDPDIGEVPVTDMAEQRDDAILVGLAADQPDIRMLRCLPGEMLAAAEADLEPDLARRRREEARRIDGGLAIRQRDLQLRQQRVEESGAPGAQLAPAATAEAVDQPNPGTSPI